MRHRYHRLDNALFGLVLAGLGLLGYGLYQGGAWLLMQLQGLVGK